MRRVLATFGNGDCGRLGHSSFDHACEEVPRVVRALVGVQPLASVAAGGAHTAALDGSGTLFTWGLNDKGQLGACDWCEGRVGCMGGSRQAHEAALVGNPGNGQPALRPRYPAL